MIRRMLVVLAVATFAFLAASPAKADTVYGFVCVQPTNAANCASVAAQMQLTIYTTGLPAGQVGLRIDNLGPIASIISEIYFDGPSVLNYPAASIVDSGAGVTFSSSGCNPNNLPGGTNLNPDFVTTYCSEENQSGNTAGVNPSEWIAFIFTLNGSATLQDVLNDMQDGDLRIGLHVIAISPSGDSDAMVTVPNTTEVPEPGTLALFGTGLLGMAGVIRRRLNL